MRVSYGGLQAVQVNQHEERECCRQYQTQCCDASPCKRHHGCVYCGEMGHSARACFDLRRARQAEDDQDR